MNRRTFLLLSSIMLAAAAVAVRPDRVVKTDEEWKKVLTPAQFHVARKKGTETPFTGPNWDNHAAGAYLCVCCDLPLFSSKNKFDSGTGWPSFWQPIAKDAVREAGPRDSLLVPSGDGVRSVHGAEVLCARCDAHLGDVFDDGPKPTGLRYCMNGTALRFIPAR